MVSAKGIGVDAAELDGVSTLKEEQRAAAADSLRSGLALDGV